MRLKSRKRIKCERVERGWSRGGARCDDGTGIWGRESEREAEREWNGTKMRTSESVRAQSMGVAGAEKFVWPCMLESGGDIQKKVNGTKGL
jgi:hypothetical protein